MKRYLAREVFTLITQRRQEINATRRSPLDKQKGVRGAQYVSIKYTERLAEAGIEPSVGSVGDSYDCESVGAAWRA